MNNDAAHSTYRNPLADRYSSPDMLRIFSDDNRYRTWRRLWIALAEAQMELGLDVRPEQIAEMRAREDEIDYDRVRALEKELRHDVMAHITAFGELCPSARPIIHLGATSCFVTDNADLILIRQALELVRRRLTRLLETLRDFALEHRALPALAYTHFQPAQVTTVGKRAAIWAQDFLIDLEEISRRLDGLRMRGVKGTTGTQASFLRLFDGDSEKVERLDRSVAEKMGFRDVFRVTGQTYTRKVDVAVLHALAGIADSAHKLSTDVRLLQGLGELEEPFAESQVGSTAMPYKRNPMRMERVSSLAKYVLSEARNGEWVHATQWFERTLDDSANRRLSIPQSFLAVDALLMICVRVVEGLVVYPEVVGRRLREEFPFMASENLLMLAVRAGGDRQALHESIRLHAMEVTRRRRAEGARNDLLQRLAADEAFASVHHRIEEVSDPAAYTGRSAEQVERFFRDEVQPALDRVPPAEGESWDVWA